MSEYAFDIKLNAAVRVQAASEEEARQILAAVFNCADCNGGMWPWDQPVTFEASLVPADEHRPELYEVDGEEPEASQIAGPCTYCGHPDHWRPDCPLIAEAEAARTNHLTPAKRLL